MLDVEEFLHFAATLIQSAFRGFSQRRLYRLQVRREHACGGLLLPGGTARAMP